MTKEEELRQLEELRRIRAEERKKMQMQDDSYMEDSAFAPDNSYLKESAFTDSAFSDSAFTDSAFSDSAFAPEAAQTVIQNPMQNIRPKQPTQQRQPQQPMQQRQPQQPMQQRHPQQPRQPQQPMQQRQPQQSVQPRHPQQPMQPRQPQQSVQPRHPQQPMQPRQPHQPMQPRHPQQPVQPRQPQQKMKKKKKHPFIKFVVILLIVVAVICGLGIGLAVRAINKMDRIETNVSKRGDNFKGDLYNILLIGQDAREGQDIQRADSIILLTINKKTHSVTLTSIMRDTYVNIPGYGGNRINAAFAFGGVDLLDQTIEENFGIKIDGNLMVDFQSFIGAMTAVGNLDIELTAEEAEFLNQNPDSGSTNDIANEEWHLHEGMNSLTPSQVLGYSRIRHLGNSDWDRTNRQRKVIMAVVNKVKHGHIFKGFKVLNGVSPNITTDISTMNVLKIGLSYIRCSGGGMQSFYLPAEGTYEATYVDGMAVLVPDIEANKRLLQQYMQGIDPSKEE